MTQKGPLLYLELEIKLILLNDRFELSTRLNPIKMNQKCLSLFYITKVFFFKKKVSVF